MTLIKVREYTDARDIIAHAKALHRKTFHDNALVGARRRADLLAEARAQAEQEQARARARAEERQAATLEEEMLALEERIAAQAGVRALYEQTIPLEMRERDPRSIIRRIAEAHGVTAADISGEGRTKTLCHARFAAIAAVRDANPTMSLPRIGKHFGDRDHTTIMHALKRAEEIGPDALSKPVPKPIREKTRDRDKIQIRGMSDD